MAMSAEHRSKFAALGRQWWHLHIKWKIHELDEKPNNSKSPKLVTKYSQVIQLGTGVLFQGEKHVLVIAEQWKLKKYSFSLIIFHWCTIEPINQIFSISVISLKREVISCYRKKKIKWLFFFSISSFQNLCTRKLILKGRGGVECGVVWVWINNDPRIDRGGGSWWYQKGSQWKECL